MITELVTDTLITLSSVVCTGNSKPSFVPVQTIQGKQLEAMSANSVADVLKYFAGVQIKDYGGVGGMKTINVRSMGTQHTGVYIDGVRITNCQNGTVDLSKYSIQNMECIELYNANKTGVLLSASEYASASTVYFTTKRPTETGISLRGAIGSFGTRKGSIYVSGKNKWFIDTELLKTDGNYKFKYKSEVEDTIGHRHNSDISYVRVEGGYFSNHFRGHAYVYRSDRGLPGGIVKRLSDKYQDVGREQDLNVFVQGSFFDEGKVWSFKTIHKYAVDVLHANTNFIENQFNRYDNTYTQTDLYNGYVVGVYPLNWLRVSNSTDIRISDLLCNVKGFKYVKRYDIKSSVASELRKGLFALNASLLYTNVKDHSEMATADRMIRWTPSVFLSVGNSSIQGRVYYKNIFRAPTLNDFYYTHVGVRTLKPERTSQWDVGYSVTTSKVRLQTDFYWNKVTNKIICVPNGAAYDWKMMNKGEVKAFGWDMSVTLDDEIVKWFTALSYQDVRDYSDKRDESSYGHQLLYSPKWSVTSVVTIPIGKWEISVSDMWVDKRWWSYASEDDFLGAYNSLDLRVSYRSRFVEAALNVNNILDKQYELVQRWPLPGRQIELSLKIKY